MKNNEYLTKDLQEASYLNLLGYDFDLRKEGSFYWFVFKDDGSIAKKVQDFWLNKPKGKLKGYADSIRTLKDLIFSRKG